MVFWRPLKYVPDLLFCRSKFMYISTRVCYSSYQNRNGKYLFFLHLLWHQTNYAFYLVVFMVFWRPLKYLPKLLFCRSKFMYISTRVCYSSYQNRNGKYLFLLHLFCHQNQLCIVLSCIHGFLKALKIRSRPPFLQIEVYVY